MQLYANDSHLLDRYPKPITMKKLIAAMILLLVIVQLGFLQSKIVAHTPEEVLSLLEYSSNKKEYSSHDAQSHTSCSTPPVNAASTVVRLQYLPIPNAPLSPK
ncbi:hypothetical protein SAMN04488028_10495 [Reichenbachiella agariperforans]|uniref:Uncharacterized protein n=1 Tax=Reichenbachiella agariperforans TaxID=156994 RepID=A0A1M6RAC0_REIAG|nr:hypothetical protein SAMN04488028_10495 [Reichenbachiella agariperforans]